MLCTLVHPRLEYEVWADRSEHFERVQRRFLFINSSLNTGCYISSLVERKHDADIKSAR